ncbi:MAG: LysR substrate-binding domain-containing protein, partial [Pseudolabrys sp.]|nr:LysR substrate-binding domain-containing protein [Pseudolabrys sp.]
IIGRYSPEEESKLDQTLLSQEQFAVVVSSNHPILDKGPAIELAQTVAYDWIATPPRTAARQALISMFTQAGLRVPAVKIETASTEIMKAALLDCQMIGLLPEGIARRYAEVEQIEILPFEIDYPPAPLLLIQRRNETALPSVARFCQTLLDVARESNAKRKARLSQLPHSRRSGRMPKQ